MKLTHKNPSSALSRRLHSSPRLVVWPTALAGVLLAQAARPGVPEICRVQDSNTKTIGGTGFTPGEVEVRNWQVPFNANRVWAALETMPSPETLALNGLEIDPRGTHLTSQASVTQPRRTAIHAEGASAADEANQISRADTRKSWQVKEGQDVIYFNVQPERSDADRAAARAEIPPVTYTPPSDRWDALPVSRARLAEKAGVPCFSSSSYRYYDSLKSALAQDVGSVRGCISIGPCHLEPHHPDLFWYGVHPTEALFTVLGPECETVARMHTPDTDVVTGTWSNGRTGVLYGLRTGSTPHKVIIFGDKGVAEQEDSGDYANLMREVVQFFRTGKPPVSAQETIALFAFMEAADVSKARNGAPVTISEVIEKARKEAESLVDKAPEH